MQRMRHIIFMIFLSQLLNVVSFFGDGFGDLALIYWLMPFKIIAFYRFSLTLPRIFYHQTPLSIAVVIFARRILSLRMFE